MKKKRTKKEWLWEFSKKLVFLLTILYIIERLFVMTMLVIRCEQSMETFITTGTEVFLASVIAYCLKAGFENVFKIKKNSKESEDEEV